MFALGRADKSVMVRTLQSTAIFIIALGLSACGTRSTDRSSVVIYFPATSSSSEMKSSQQNVSWNWNQVCFAINITAKDLSPQSRSQCDVNSAIFTGSVAPGGELSVDVPVGTERRLEVFAYLRSSTSEICPTLAKGFGSLDRSRVVRVGSVESFDTLKQVVSLTVEVKPPETGQNLVVQYNLPSSCIAGSTPASPGRPVQISVGRGTVSGGGFVIPGQIREASSSPAVEISGGSYRIRMEARQ